MNSKLNLRKWGESGLNTVKSWPRWAKVAGLVGLLVIFAAVWGATHQSGKTALVKTGKIERQDVRRVVFTNGNLEAQNQQTFFSPVESTLMELNVKLGDRVTQGQVLGRLDTMELGRLYQQALSNLAGKEAELAGAMASNDEQQFKAAEAAYIKDKNHRDRIKSLFAAGASSLADLEEAESILQNSYTAYQEAQVRNEKGVSQKQIAALQTQVELAAQEVAQCQERLELATFTAAFDGVVIAADVKAGDRIQAGSELIVIANDQALQAVSRVNEVDGGELQVGQAVAITCLALPGQTFAGTITSIGAAAIQEQGQNGSSAVMKIPVAVQLQGDSSRLKLGYNVNLSITTMEVKDALVVPIEAVVENEEQKQVWVLKNGVLELRTIETQRGNDLSEIVVSGLEEGEEVVKNPSPQLLNGQKAIVAPEEIQS
ncbi:MAG: efflux RND transporter periplasmic adaptor subunit [Syntrophomonadaceae bacterium]|nr:efflux RND transporter periplasmic adaptor subunit [Syntrophomonadaceae bacterium]